MNLESPCVDGGLGWEDRQLQREVLGGRRLASWKIGVGVGKKERGLEEGRPCVERAHACLCGFERCSGGYPGNRARIWTILISRRLSFEHLKTRTTVHWTTTLTTLIWAVALRKCGLLCTASSRCNCGTCSVLWACVKWHDGLLDCHTRHELSRIELGWLRGASNP